MTVDNCLLFAVFVISPFVPEQVIVIFVGLPERWKKRLAAVLYAGVSEIIEND